MASATITREQHEAIGADYVAGRATLVELAQQNGIEYHSLVSVSETHEWGRLREECKQARLRAPIEAVLRMNGINGHSVTSSAQQIHVDLTAAVAAYAGKADGLRVNIDLAHEQLTALQQRDVVDGDEVECAVRVLDRLLERQRIMLRIPSPGRDSSHARQLPAEPAEPREV